MDMKKYSGTSFIGLQDVADGPLVETIAAVEEGKYGRPVLKLESGRQFSVNTTNNKVLVRSFGDDGRDWIGGEIELFAGTTTYNKAESPSVLVKARTPADGSAGDDTNDETAL